MWTPDNDRVVVRGVLSPRFAGGIDLSLDGSDSPVRATRVADTQAGPSVRPDATSAAAARNKALCCTTAQQLKATLDAKLPAQPADTPIRMLEAGHAAAGSTYQRAEDMSRFGVDAVAAASQLAGTGQVTTFGTLSRDGGQLRYSPTPADRLIVPGRDGGTVELKFEDFQGNTQSAAAFLANDHSLSFTAQHAGDLDMRISDVRRGEAHDITARGRITFGDVDYDADLHFAETDHFRYDGPGGEGERAVAITGTIESDDAKLTVDETASDVSATAEVRDGLGGSAHTTTRTIRSTLETGGDTYVWNDVQTRESFRNGRASDVEHWRAEGDVTRNGEPYGSYRLREAGGQLQMVIDRPQGALVLESFR